MANRDSQEPVDAFVLFNESESRVGTIVERLKGQGVTTHYWDRDIPAGGEWEKIEAQHIRDAAAIVVFLGSAGWGPSHLKLAQSALLQRKTLIPVLIGDPQPDDFLHVDKLFQRLRYVDMKSDDPEAFQVLVRGIREARQARRNSSSFNALINRIIDGNESDRFSVLRRILQSRDVDRTVLSARLRNDIENSFAASATNFASSIREPKKITSIRSWMLSCLIATDPEAPENREFVLRYLSASQEPEASIRYWVLCQLYVARVSYLNQAAEYVRSDNSAEIALMGRAILSSGDTEFLEECRSRLKDENFEIAWTVLRMLRAIPIVALTADVCVQFNRSSVGTPLAYDSLSALSSPEMAAAAAPILLATPGLDATVLRVVGEAGRSDRAATRRFAILLAQFPHEPVWQIVNTAFANPETRLGADFLLQALKESSPEDDHTVNISAISPDTNDVDHDYLDIREDVQTLAAIMLAKEVPPPLAIGLFGDWGSGKSFFMSSLRNMTRRLANSGQLKLCSSVVSIEFNAWHYADTNLWASMVDFILEQLSDYVAPKPSPEEQDAAFVVQLGSARTLERAAKEEKARTQELITARAKDLEDAKREREQKEISLKDLKASDFQALMAANPELKKSLEDAMKELGFSTVIKSEKDLAMVAADALSLRNWTASLLGEIWKKKSRWFVIPLILVILFVIPLLAYLIEQLTHSPLASRVAVVNGEILAVIAAAVKILRDALARVRSTVNTVQAAKGKVDELVAKKRAEVSEREKAIQNQIAALKAKEQESASRLSLATERVAELEERIEAARRGQSLPQFIVDRSKSDDYRKHLGLMSTVRRDLEALAKRLSAPPQAGEKFNKIDRIILYIDDLDRCPEKKVLEVLEAVHLLLAYPIFVVVVGVDPRWLVHSLRHSFAALASAESSPLGGSDFSAATPQNYMEKIFQIPFSLQPMSQRGYNQLIDALLYSGQPQDGDLHVVSPLNPPSSLTDSSQGQQAPAPVESKEVSAQAIPEPVPDRQKATELPQPAAQREQALLIHEDSMTIRAWETRFAERLFPLIPTPRSAKRFSNIYRILKAPIRSEALASFEGTEVLPGDFRVPMTLLAMMISHAKECRSIFPVLREEALALHNPTAVLQSLTTQFADVPAITKIQARIEEIVSDPGFPTDPSIYQFWIPRVSRFTFDLVQILDLDRKGAF